MELKYKTDEIVCLGDKVLIDIAGFKFSGKVVYIESIGIESDQFDWCVFQNVKGILVQWDNPEQPKAILYAGENSESIANYIQIEDTKDEDLDFFDRK